MYLYFEFIEREFYYFFKKDDYKEGKDYICLEEGENC